MNVKKIYDKIVKKLDYCYDLYLQLDKIPRGSIIKKTINNNIYHYLQYRAGDKVKSIYIFPHHLEHLKQTIKNRDHFKKEQRKNLEEVKQLIKVLKIYDKEFYYMAKEEYQAYKLDVLPSNEKKSLNINPNIHSNSDSEDKNLSNDDIFNKMMVDWANNKIRMRDIEKYLISKFVS